MAEMKQFGIDLELDDAVAQGHYSNLAIISHSTSEFIIDFATVLPGVQKARVKSGIILTGSAKEKPVVSEVVAVGPGGLVDGEKVEMYLKPGDRVLLAKYAGTEVKVDGESYTILRQGDVLAIVE